MKILLFALDVPATPRAPGSPRVFDLLRGLKLRGHTLALVCGVSSPARWEQFLQEDGGAQFLDATFPVPATPQLQFSGRVRNLLSPQPPFHMRYRAPAFFSQMSVTARRALAEFQPNILHIDQLAAAQYVPEAYRGALVIDPHDAISLTEARKLDLDTSASLRRNLARRFMRYQISKIKNYELAMAQRADAYVVNAEPDRAYLDTFLPREKLRAIPNGVDTSYYHPAPEVAPQHEVVFTGAYTYAFNVDAMLYFHSSILPRLRSRFSNLRLTVVGSHPPPELRQLGVNDPLTTVTGFVDDVRPYVWQSAVFVSPLRGGTGMKNKLLNAMAMGKPIVATPHSAEGLGVCDGEQMLLAESPEAFADAVSRLLDDPALAQRLGAAGRAFVERDYSYARLGARFETLYSEILSRRQGHAA